MKWLCQVWGQGEHACINEKSPHTLLEPLWKQTQPNQMGSNPNANLNHHMKLQSLASCQVTKSTDLVESHGVFYLLHMGCYSTPPRTQDLVPRSKLETTQDTQNGDDLRAPTLLPSPNDVPTELS